MKITPPPPPPTTINEIYILHCLRIIRQCLSLLLPSSKLEIVEREFQLVIYALFDLVIARSNIESNSLASSSTSLVDFQIIQRHSELEPTTCSILKTGEGSDESILVEISGCADLDAKTLEQIRQVILACLRNSVVEDLMLKSQHAWIKSPQIHLTSVGGPSGSLKRSGNRSTRSADDLPREFLVAFSMNRMTQLMTSQTTRFSRMLNYFQGLLISTSPFVEYPPPVILQRMENQEVENTIVTGGGSDEDLHKPHAPERPLSRLSLYGRLPTSQTGSSSSNLSAEERERRKRLSERYILNPCDRISLKTIAAIDGTAETFLEMQKITILNTRFPNLQSLPSSETETLSEGSATSSSSTGHKFVFPPCKSQLETFQFYNFNDGLDLTLKQFLERLIDEADLDCPNCHDFAGPIKNLKHVQRFSHGSGRVKVTVDRDTDDVICNNNNNQGDNQHKIWMWYRCDECRTSTPPIEQTAAALEYSFAKYIENLLYNPLMTCHEEPLCKSPHRWSSSSLSPLASPTFSDFKWSTTFGKLYAGASSSNSSSKLATVGASASHRMAIKRIFYLRGGFTVTFQFEDCQFNEIKTPTSATSSKSVTHLLWKKQQQQRQQQRNPSPGSGAENLDNVNGCNKKLALIEKVDQFFDDMKRQVKSHATLNKPPRILVSYSDRKKFLIKLAEERRKLKEILLNNDINYCGGVESRGDNVGDDLENLVETKFIGMQREYQFFIEKVSSDQIPAMIPCKDSLYLRLRNKPAGGFRSVSEWIYYALSSPTVQLCLDIMEEITTMALEEEMWMDPAAATMSMSSADYSKNMQCLHSRLKSLMSSGKFERQFSLSTSAYSEQAEIEDCLHIKLKIKHLQSFPDQQPTESGVAETTAISGEETTTVIIQYAYLFVLLRDRYAIDTPTIIQSLMDCAQWTPVGGKSSASFWKTSDDLLVIKDDRKKFGSLSSLSYNNLIKGGGGNSGDFIQKYLSYILFNRFPLHSKGVSFGFKPSLLVPILGVFSIKSRRCTTNTASGDGGGPVAGIGGGGGAEYTIGSALAYHEVVMMKNLYAEYPNVDQQYDLKGIIGRSISQPSSSSSSANSSTSKSSSWNDRLNFIFRRKSTSTTTTTATNTISSSPVSGVTGSEEKSGSTTSKSKGVLGDDCFMNTTVNNAKDPTLVHPYSRHLLLSTIKEDTDFLIKSGIIDYSLLVGVIGDDQLKQGHQGSLVVGIVDYQTEYGLLKAIEEKGKMGVKLFQHVFGGKDDGGVGGIGAGQVEVTVRAPRRYADRMLSALVKYFPLVPDRWSSHS